MRLIRCKDLKLEEFYNPPPFAILSHTWGEDEVTYQEMLELTPKTQKKRGFDKILHAAILAEEHGLDYVWVDTCSIDKSSSAELSEAINSMFKWYQQAEICFVVLSDVSSTRNAIHTGSGGHEQERHRHAGSIFESCRWITRGWTLQELIAPRSVLFYDAEYNCFGSKQDLRDPLSRATGINRDVLESSDPSSASIAQRMSWAAKRETSREEDLAYCLLGLFGVHMPLLYGEGSRAFLRLQEEILKSSDDHSLFAWKSSRSSRRFDDDYSYCGLLALHPADFDVGIVSYAMTQDDGPAPAQIYEDQSTTITNKGIRFSAPLIPIAQVEQIPIARQSLIKDSEVTTDDLFVAVLNCNKGLGIVLLKLEDRHQFVRVSPHRLVELRPKEKLAVQRFYVRQDVRIPIHHQSSRLSSLVVRYNDYVNHTSGKDRKIDVREPIDREGFLTDGTDNVYSLPKGRHQKSREHFIFVLTISSAFHDVVELTPESEAEWRLRNRLEQQRYGAEYDSDDDIDPWYNRWRGSVNVRLVFNRLTGAYKVFYWYDTTGKGIYDEVSLVNHKQYTNFGGLLRVADLGRARVVFDIRAQTKLNNGRADIVLDIRESIVEKDRFTWLPKKEAGHKEDQANKRDGKSLWQDIRRGNLVITTCGFMAMKRLQS